jgi:acetyl-CoA acetyltransferase
VTSREAAIVGVAECDLGVTGRSVLELNTQAVTRALDDAGLRLADVDGLATNAVSRFSTTQLAEYLGLQPAWTDSTVVGGSSFVAYVARAVEAVRHGRCEVAVVTYGSNQRSGRTRRMTGHVADHLPAAQFEQPYGALYPATMYALAAQRHLHEFGTTEEDLARIAVAARAWALHNPKAYRHDAGPLTVDDVLASAPLSSPLKTLDCCLVTDGGGAVVVTSLDRARDLRPDPVLLLGHGERTTHDSMSQMPDLTLTGAVASGRTAFAQAGLTPADVDVAQIYDSFTITVALSLEALGFCPRGGFAGLVAEGGVAPGGALALNTSGGGLSYCHPGQLGILLVVEAVRQLRGECGARQVPGAEVALVHGTGGILSHHATSILAVDR